MFEILNDIIQAHIQIDKYYAEVITIDSLLAILAVSLFYTLYMTWRKQLRVRDAQGVDEWIGLIMSWRKCPKTPLEEPCKYIIKYRRRSWYFWADLIHLSRIYYQPPEGCEKPIEFQLRKAYIIGERLEHRENPNSQFDNYYYLSSGGSTPGRYEEPADYIMQGHLQLALMTRSVQLGIQADSETAARSWHVDTEAIMIPGLDIPEVGYDASYAK